MIKLLSLLITDGIRHQAKKI